jgi:ribonuclease E
MTMRMLIDARHPEETRVAVVKGNRIEEFDFESAERKQLKGNIYLAKVTRVEPSLQAAFVDYGGNRHGFLAFSEIHPDYYQIPKEDREALLREEAEHAREEEALRAQAEAQEEEAEAEEDGDADDGGVETVAEPSDEEQDGEEESEAESAPRGRRRRGGSSDEVDALRDRRMSLRRRYKIQDVIRRRQVLLVQVVKEERGNKGAALTTYLSLAGRYCVLMPNTSHGGGISRKISSAADRKRLKAIMAELHLPPTMGCIVRTAGLQRTKAEIKRDFDYLARLWDEIRAKTLASAAPSLIYADSDLIKRAIRDIYNREIEEVFVEGESGWKAARNFMKLLMPSHAKKVQLYSDTVPLFHRYGVEDQLLAMYQPVVQLRSGGYLVINPTEALVSIDVNSGRSTREHNIEETALKTNLEAATEIARQLRLRDMAGLVVIDFIDMESNSNTRKVEKAMKAALADDRARIQVGRISAFGLMEMSRQRLRTGVLEASTRSCPHCEGTGLVRTTSSAALSSLRMLEEEAARGRGSLVTLRIAPETAAYVLNRYRREIVDIEERYGVAVQVIADEALGGSGMAVDVSGPPASPRRDALAAPAPAAAMEEDELGEIDEEEEEDQEEEVERAAGSGQRRDGEDGEGRRRRRRRRRGGRRDSEPAGEAAAEAAGEAAERDQDQDGYRAGEEGEGEASPRRRSRRGRRGGRRRSGQEGAAQAAGTTPVEEGDQPLETEGDEASGEPFADEAPAPEPVEAQDAAEAEDAAEAPAAAKPRRSRRKAAEAEPADGEEAAEASAAAKPRRSRRKPSAPEEQEVAAKPNGEDHIPPSAAEPAEVEPTVEAEAVPEEGAGPRRGWWQRTFGP